MSRDDCRQSDPHAFRLDHRGLGRVFGELEAAIMEAVWTGGRATVADVCRALGSGAHYKTVTTVMNRLVDKGALRRAREARCFVYTAAESRDAFVERVSRRVAEGLVLDFGESAVAQFVDALDAVDPVLLEKLRALVAARPPQEDRS